MRIALAMVVALAACGDDSKQSLPDGGTNMTPDAMVDAPPEQLTLTKYVIDMITTQTTATAQPRPYAEFATLIDPDGASNNLAAYQPLF